MKNQILIGLLGLSLLSCENREPNMPSITYQASTIECKVGDVVTFSPSGQADFVAFWSGEKGSNYHFIKQTTPSQANFSFTYRSWTTNANDDMEFKVMISKDYIPQTLSITGKQAAQAIITATWEDITDQVYRLNKHQTEFKKSIDFDLLKYKDTPFFIGFVHTHTKPSPQNLFIKGVEIGRTTNELGIEDNIVSPVTRMSYTGNSNTTGWYSLLTFNLDVDPGITATGTRTWSVKDNVDGMNGEPCVLAGGSSFSDKGKLLTQEKWLISPMISLKKGEQDKGVAIKNRESLVRPHEHVYTTPGVYKAVFISTNSYLGGEKQQTQEITITVK